MIKDEIFSRNEINYINYLVIKEDRLKIDSDFLKDTRTHKILSFKDGDNTYVDEIIGWVQDVLDDEEFVMIPYPSTDPNKAQDQQLAFVIIKEICKRKKNIIDGSGVLLRGFALPKNTRDEIKQYESLSVGDGEIIQGKNILLFDDVITTGSSMRAGIKKINEYSPKNIKGLTIARKVYLRDIPLSGLY